jgi:DNA-binding MarR family transcriptional regulator
MAHQIPLTPIDLDLLAVLAHEQARHAGQPLRLLDLAVQCFGVESEARHVLQRLLVHGLIELEQDEQDRRSCVGVVTRKAALPPAAGVDLKTPGAGH